MLLIDYSLETPKANLAFEAAMIESVEENPPADPASLESLRLWEMPSLCVVMGRGSKEAEVHRSACEEDQIPVLQRFSGGASIVAGPGCLMYSLLLSLDEHPALRSIDLAHSWVMQRVAQAVASIVPEIRLQGTCDLTLRDRKFSGNAVRYKRDWLLYHGTLLYRFPLESASRYLKMPPRQPVYRESRDHSDFLINLDCDPMPLRRGLAMVWQADQDWTLHPHSNTIMETAQRILETKYA